MNSALQGPILTSKTCLSTVSEWLFHHDHDEVVYLYIFDFYHLDMGTMDHLKKKIMMMGDFYAAHIP